MDTEKVGFICGTIIILAFLGFMYTLADDREEYNTCIKAGGSWVNRNCIQWVQKQ